MMSHRGGKTNATTQTSDTRSTNDGPSRHVVALPGRRHPRRWTGSSVFVVPQLVLLGISWGCPGYLGVANAATASKPAPFDDNKIGGTVAIAAATLRPRSAAAAAAAAQGRALEAEMQIAVDIAEGEESQTEPRELFSPAWLEEYGRGDPGCELARGSFMWRGQGFGSNINNMLNAWVYALAVEGWVDMTVVIDDNQMAHVDCADESQGQASTGWGCLFLPAPHLCTFESDVEWEEHLVTAHIPRADLAEAARLDQDAVRFHPEEIVASLDGLAVDHLGALAVVAKYLWSHITPWLQADVDFIAAAPPSDVFESSPFLGLHVRRGDKISMGEANFHPCEEYLDAAVEYLESDDCDLTVEDIKGIWVASDDPEVVNRVKEIAPSYLPSVSSDTIFWAAGGVEGGPDISRAATRTDKATYADFAYTLADLQQCAAADVFVGTYSSNMGRLLVLLRESIGLKARDSAISIDGPWRAGRQRRRRRQRRFLKA